MPPANKELVGASTSVLVLGVLKRGSSYGYDIVRQMNEQANGAFTWQEGTVYPLLHKLERQKLIQSRWQEAPGARKRKYYSLTATGRAALRSGTEQWNQFHQMILQLAGATHA